MIHKTRKKKSVFNSQGRQAKSPSVLQNQQGFLLPQDHRQQPSSAPATNFSFGNIPVIQPKSINCPATDRYEREADSAANSVMQIPDRQVDSSHYSGLTSYSAMQSEQRLSGRERNYSQAANTSSESVRRGPFLAAQEKAFFEPRFGHDFSQVRIHADARSARMADALNAHAFTVGQDIYFGRDNFYSASVESDSLLGHELAHVVQQTRTGPALQAKLKITGKADHLTRTMTLLNSGLFGYTVSIDKSGNVTIAETGEVGPPSPQQTALAGRLMTVINDAKDVIMTVSAGSDTLGGSFDTADFDIADLEVYGIGGLIHEIVEQHQKQAKGIKDFGTATTGAHGEATRAESEVTGLIRGADKVISMTQNADGTIDAVIETPHTFPDGKVKKKVSTIKSNNIISVSWK